MNKKTLTIGFLSAMIAGSMLFTSSASAFWPFNRPAQKGEVKAVVMTEEMSEERLTTEQLSIAVKNKLVSETQRREIQTRLSAIKVEREKLKAMREAFTAWLKANNLERQKLIETKLETKNVKVTPTVRTLPIRGKNTTK